METTQTEQTSLMPAQPQKEHQWLQKFVGEWTYETEVMMEPDRPPVKSTGTETVRSLGGLWVLAEGQGEMPGFGPATTLMTLGYDPQKQCYVGTWVGSILTYLWQYEGELDAGETVLTLNADGPVITGEEKIGKYKDAIEFKSDDHRVLTAHILTDDGQWQHFMTTHYWRQQ
ncbi:DUF1579 domain-containing protein [Desertifilum sp. FACHB-1129]|uniref:DUF1579 domain-containing protein n=2 Tax=Desertifilum tharense IPPAS B-1220 TaxID=1781255 RepID=A0ACD5GPY9_9CYAN|nr:MULTISPECIES: DUF1579 domain-containing protein [Desertifilum]MBD2313613.1 DUF1579 domain-containing protein [Desertifilum sp. FACHB-1129]MBD2320566.1 DUF1579 domain-containing protein [Desertifilum sp. FACHB-866]MBD2330694.1 DUF1579 domain-containing protein [Desertifilum sp. FACHB-868]MDA0210161.1 DUF1579 domain-containing protein [Cyanobacteria bacterium FC1]